MCGCMISDLNGLRAVAKYEFDWSWIVLFVIQSIDNMSLDFVLHVFGICACLPLPSRFVVLVEVQKPRCQFAEFVIAVGARRNCSVVTQYLFNVLRGVLLV